MIKGLDVFRRHFEGYSNRYVLIGGVAASLAMEDVGLPNLSVDSGYTKFVTPS